MNRFRVLFAASVVSLLAACNVTSSQVAGYSITAQTLASAAGQAELVNAARNRVATYCAYLPSAQTIIAIAQTFSPSTVVTLDLVDQVAQGICVSVANPSIAYASMSYASGKAVPKRGDGIYRGVAIRGQRLNK